MKKINLLIISLLVTFAFAQPTFAIAKDTGENATKVETKEQLKLNLNSDDAKEIARVLTGIGMKKAVSIVEYRDSHGGFKSIDELASVKGIGVKIIAKNQGRIFLK